MQTCLLLILPLEIFESHGELFLDKQACNGLRLWLENFDRVIICGPLRRGTPPENTQSLRSMTASGLLKVVPLPSAYTPALFVRHYFGVRKQVLRLIHSATHLQFAIGGLFGDWGAFATLWATGRNRKVAVWTDRVESSVLRFKAHAAPQPRRTIRWLYASVTKYFEQHVIRRGTIGLFHGMDTYTAYSRFSRKPYLVHDIHLGPEARISAERLQYKSARPVGPLRIIYAGRVHFEKGFEDWIKVLAEVKSQGVAFLACWYGDGPGFDEAQRLIAKLGVAPEVVFPGPIQDRSELIEYLREADIFVFCHKTKESPRCLVEALLSGTPIVGYESTYAKDLIERNGGGILTPIHDVNALATLVVRLSRDHELLRDLFNRSAEDGFRLTDVDVFHHRSELIKSM